MAKNNLKETAEVPTVRMTVDKVNNSILVEWRAVDVPEGFSQDSLFYVVELQKDDKPYKPDGLPKTSTILSCIFEGIDLSGVHLFSAKVQAFASEGKKQQPCGDLQVGKIEVSDGVIISVPQVKGVYANTDDDDKLSVRWDEVDTPGVTYSVRLVGDHSKLDSTPKENIRGNIITFSQKESGIETDKEYVVYVRASTSEKKGPESEGFDFTAGVDLDDEYDANFNENAGKAGDPINMGTGSFSYQNIDLQIQGSPPLIFQTFYFSTDALKSRYENKDEPDATPLVLGNGWSHTYMTSITVNKKGNKVTVYWGEGGKSRYKNKSGEFVQKGVYDGSELDFRGNKYILTKHDQTQYIFDEDGKLIQILSPIKNSVTLEYVEGFLSRVTDEKSSNYFKFLYTISVDPTLRRLQKVEDNFGRFITYEIISNNLITYKDAEGGTRKFTYNSKSLMETAKDQKGDVFTYDVFIYNKYDDDKVIFQQDANAYALRDTDKYGLSISYEKSKKKLIATTTDNNGNNIIYTSDKRGNLLRKETLLADNKISVQEYEYDGFNNKIRESNFEGNKENSELANVILYSYDGNLNLLESRYEGDDKAESYKYNRLNQKVEYVDRLGNRTKYIYNSSRELEKIEYPLEQKEAYEYIIGPIKGLIKTYTDKLGNKFKLTYKGDQLATIKDPYENETAIVEYKYGLPKKYEIRDAKGKLLKTIIYDYNKMGVKTEESILYNDQPANKAFKTFFTLDEQGLVTEEKNTEGNITLYTYDRNMNLVKTKFPDVGTLTSEEIMKYDRNNNLIEVNTGAGLIEQYAYNAVNRCIRKTDANGKIYEYGFKMEFTAVKPYPIAQNIIFPKLDNVFYSEETITDVFQRPVQIKNKSGQSTKFTYVEINNQLKVTTSYPEAISGNQSTKYKSEEVYDALGRLISSTDEEGHVTTIKYDNKITETSDKMYVSIITETNPLGIQTITHINSNDEKTFEKKGQQESLFSYDALGRILTVKQRINATEYVQLACNYSYDSNCLKVETVQKKTTGDETLSTSYFNGLNQLVNQKDNSGTSTERVYNVKGELEKYLVAKEKKISYEYDKAGRNIVTRFSDNSSVTNKYNGANCIETNQLNATGNVISKQIRTFDAWNRLETLTDLKGSKISYQYNPENQLKQLIYPKLTRDTKVIAVDYVYDNLQRMIKVNDWENRTTEYSYSPVGLLKKTIFSNKIISEYTFDEAQRLTGLQNSKNSTLISKCVLELNQNGNPVKSNVLQPLAPVFAESTTDFTYNPNNQLISVNGENIAYNTSGNPTSLPEAKTIRFNDLNLMTQYNSDEYTYDAQGLRISSKIKNTVLNYVTSPNAYHAPYLSMLNPFNNDNAISNCETSYGDAFMENAPQSNPVDQVLQITNEKGELEKRFVYGMGLIAEIDGTGEYLVHHYDERGSTLAMSNQNGDISSRYAYGAYGELLNRTGTSNSPFLYNGQQGVLTDSNNLYSMRSRFYQPGRMHFLQQDFLLGNPYRSQSLNRYAYVGGNPLSFVDPLGLDKVYGSKSGGSSKYANIWVGIIIGLGALGLGLAAWQYYKYRKRAKNFRIAIAGLRNSATLSRDLGNFEEAFHLTARANRWELGGLASALSRKKAWTVVGTVSLTIIGGGATFFYLKYIDSDE